MWDISKYFSVTALGKYSKLRSKPKRGRRMLGKQVPLILRVSLKERRH